jgi:enoyl reductase-like protein
MKPILISIVCLVLAACIPTRPSPDVFDVAENAIQAAELAGGDEFAPVEMRFAREKLASAKLGMEKQKFSVVVYLTEEAEINAELAIEKSRTAKSRREVNELRKSNEELHASLRETFGDEFE